MPPITLIYKCVYIDFWNCTKRYARAKCGYTLRGLRKHLPSAFLSVTQYWVRKAFERADRYLSLYAMETSAMPFALREYMIKCWKRHRDVPTSIDQLVDRAVEDLERRRKDLTLRMKKNKIKFEPLEKIENLLHCCFEVAKTFPDECGPDMRTLKTKLKTMKQDQETVDARVQRTQMRYIALRKKFY